MKHTVRRIVDRYRYSVILLKRLVATDFKVRYQGSFLGYLWSLLKPLALFLILYVVFVRFLKVGGSTPHFPVYLLLGIVLWNFFTEITMGSVGSIVAKGDLIRKINFPKYIIVLSGSLSALINLGLNFIVVFFFIIISGVELHRSALWMPFLIMELFIFSIAIAFYLSALYVKFRDATYIWEVIIQGAFYATPILYPVSMVPISAAKILLLNPVAQIIQDARYVLITDKTTTISDIYGSSRYRLIPIFITIGIAICAARYFRKNSRSFAENV
ncbi:MAG: ABC transporter permease [Patescibacteria group bacterium]